MARASYDLAGIWALWASFELSPTHAGLIRGICARQAPHRCARVESASRPKKKKKNVGLIRGFDPLAAEGLSAWGTPV